MLNALATVALALIPLKLLHYVRLLKHADEVTEQEREARVRRITKA